MQKDLVEEKRSGITILYIMFGELGEMSAAPGVRSQKMYEAFQQLGLTVKILCGDQGNAHRKQRKEKVKEIEKWLENNTPDICYIESSTFPILIKKDINLIKKLHRMNVPIGYFYRDCYRNKEFKSMIKRTGIVNRVKDAILNLLQYRTDRLLKIVDIVYFPSESMMKYFEYKVQRTLPPAAERYYSLKHTFDKVAIYVGGVSEIYGFSIMIKAFQKLNMEEEYKLILVCREDELKLSKSEILNMPWLEIHHASGNELCELYGRASVALMPVIAGYGDMAISVKLYEYLAYGLPIIAVDTLEKSRIIRKYQVGIIAEQTSDDFAEKVKELLNDNGIWNILQNNTKAAVEDKNCWIDRAMQVVQDLYIVKQEKYKI